MKGMQQLKKNASLPFRFLREDLPINGYIARVILKRFPDDTAIIDRIITPVGNEWPDLLTSTDTSTLQTGLHYLTGILTNATTDEREEIPLRLNIGVTWF